MAPATNQSGTAGQVTDGTVVVSDATTASGYPAKAVDGFPADTIVWAIDDQGVEVRPDLVISGINEGQNLGAFIDKSGTIGAARAAATRGIPAIAVSQGFGTNVDDSTAVDLAIGWLEQWRSGGSTEPIVESLNVPTCGTGTVRELQELPISTDAAGPSALMRDVDCTSTASDPKDDVAGFNMGFATISKVPSTAG